MILKSVFLLCCCLSSLIHSHPVDDVWKNERDDVIDWLLEEKIRENEERDGNLHGHIVSVNEAHEQSRRENLDEIPIEEEITAVNEDPNKRPGCQLFEGDLCLDPEDEAVVSHLIHEEDLKRNVMRDRKKLWPGNTVYYSVDGNLKHLRPKINDAINRIHGKMSQCLTLKKLVCLMEEITSRCAKEMGKEKNFQKYEHGKLDALNLPYDYDSIMHYDRYLYSKGGRRPTIIARGQMWKKLGGQLRGTLTNNDVKEIRALYGC
ncbi:hypothetical protein OS493_014479 [Desmophyllum pertusum]|uniref:Metalloendopeptidase n=1 Tax=Desmophyllum pertusum TaxID=174260 RepID=A0A9X0CKI8_9CNID|nr:hypothetical protein OS493_014479 [Desmophyllum pertusum]